jgi:hypothetical protein
MTHVSIFAALLAGMLSFLSPCVLPLVPPYLIYLTGTSLERFADAQTKPRAGRQTIAAALLFVLGFSTVFVALGAGASVIGSVLRAYSGELAIVAGIAIVIMGLHFLGITPIAWLMREKRLEVAKPVGLWGAYLMGLAFAFDPGGCRVGGNRGERCRHVSHLFARAGRAVHRGGAGGGTVRSLSRPLPQKSRPRRKGDGRASGAHRHRLSDRRRQSGELLAA